MAEEILGLQKLESFPDRDWLRLRPKLKENALVVSNKEEQMAR